MPPPGGGTTILPAGLRRHRMVLPASVPRADLRRTAAGPDPSPIRRLSSGSYPDGVSPMPPRPRSLRQPPAVQAFAPAPPGRPGDPPGPLDAAILRHPGIHHLQPAERDRFRGASGVGHGIPGPFASSMTPAQITSYYASNNITFGSGINAIKGDGAGQTIAMVDAYDPALVDSTSAGFATSDLAEFDKYFGLRTRPASRSTARRGARPRCRRHRPRGPMTSRHRSTSSRRT